MGCLFRCAATRAWAVAPLSGTIAALAAKGPGRATFGGILSGALSNPVPGKPGPALAPAASKRRAAA